MDGSFPTIATSKADRKGNVHVLSPMKISMRRRWAFLSHLSRVPWTIPGEPFLVYRQAVWYPSGTPLFQAQSILENGFHCWRSNVPLTLYLLICCSKICVRYQRDLRQNSCPWREWAFSLVSLCAPLCFFVSKRFEPQQNHPIR